MANSLFYNAMICMHWTYWACVETWRMQSHISYYEDWFSQANEKYARQKNCNKLGFLFVSILRLYYCFLFFKVLL